MPPLPHRRGQFLLTTALLGALGLSIAGCKTPTVTGSSGLLGSAELFSSQAADPEQITDWRREAAIAGERYEASPGDADAALRYARALRKTGRHGQAVAVLQQASIRHPRDMRLLGDYGRALAEVGRLKDAFAMLERAHTPDRPDWRILSAQGAVLDQMGQHEEARRYYESALAIRPGEPSVLSNLGLSYALSKDLPKAEESLREAASRGGTDKRVRQNLALVVGLQGRFKEAQEIASAALSPQEAAENMAYLKDMLAKSQIARTGSPARAAARQDESAEHTGSIKPRRTTTRAANRAAPPETAKPDETQPESAPATPAQARSRPLILDAGG